MTTCLEKSYSFGLLCVSFVNVNQFVCVLLSLYFGFEDGMCIGVGRLRILGGGGGGGGGGGRQGEGGGGNPSRHMFGRRTDKSQQAHDVVLTSMPCNDVASTSFRRHVPTRYLSSPLAVKRDIVVKILVRCMCVRPCVRPHLSGP